MSRFFPWVWVCFSGLVTALFIYALVHFSVSLPVGIAAVVAWTAVNVVVERVVFQGKILN